MRSVSYDFLHIYNAERDVGKSVRAPIASAAVSGGTVMMLYHHIGTWADAPP